MPGFADSFWTPDYATGLGVLYGKLQQGVTENRQILTIASLRADAEEQYGLKLGEIAPSVDRMTAGFAKDDGASVRKAYEGVRSEMIEASKNHQKIASNIRELVVSPFRRWCDQHEARIQNSHDDLQARIKEHTKQVELTKKLRSHYFNKCRVVEDLEEENKLAFQDPETSPKVKATPKIVLPEEQAEEEEPIELGDRVYAPEDLKKLLTHMLDNIKIGEVKVPIIGTYQNTSNGADIVEYIQKYMNGTSISYAERIGQDLVDNGFLRLVGNIGSTFANSSKMNYQWRPKVFQITGIPEKKKPLMRVTSIASSEDGSESPIASVSEMLAGWNPLNNPHPNETPADKLRREAREADERYRAAVRKLDQIRCKLEEEIVENLRFMEQCELDRLKAIKAVVLDFSGAISNVIPNLQSTVDHMMLYQETIQPLGDLRYLLENYRTGGFVPRVQAYENYYGSVEDSLVSSQVYEIVKTIYSTTAHETTEDGRIKVLQSTLGQLRLNNIATLDAIMTHFTRLIDLTSADEAYISALAQTLAPCILRPRVENSLTMNERHNYRLIRDLFAHKDAIFGELKRQSSVLGLGSTSNRPRAISTDESNRRAAMEARNRAIVDRSRANSPAPPRKHRRDRSSGASEAGRFPIHVTSPTERKAATRSSLEVPASAEAPTTGEQFTTVNIQANDSATNGTSSDSPASAVAGENTSSESSSPPPAGNSDGSPTPTPTPGYVTAPGEPEKRSSIPRSGAMFNRKPGLGNRSSFPAVASAESEPDSKRNSLAESEPKGVTLEDKPMDD
ncbi:RhoGAP and Fes/CIP4 domain protein [Aspergillus fumigatus A1163]|uniref:RhoGAP and Fes/CIP4 domain protein n=2 Tax=Aspergillus fumigatus TaxID=746128 RepID=Q4WGA0_ASPFU|nr:RhoGAP and Fes/CIP4 domain protein [Aspergillus fumigatus Af293]EAL87041.1 RhoGAP and Fes/CIP4 domain protein [Aspergillus fumigatus Af293]EDP48270.1 RhoGAP and Fes/CIP4 domain protein [Aspergillus fumigatus A1163]